MKKIILPISLLLLSITACNKDEESTDDSSRVSVINSNSESRVLLHDEDSLIEVSTTDIGYVVTPSNKKDIELKYKATIKPPTVNGNTVKATHISIDANNQVAYVSYNTEGSDYLGAVDIIDISNVKKPSIIRTLKLDNTDVSALDVSPDQMNLYLATASSDFDTPSVLETIKLKSDGDYSNTEYRTELSSYVSTDVKVIDGIVYSITGNTGGLYKSSDLGASATLVKSIPDARSISYNSSQIAVMAGTPATIYLFNRTSLALENTITPGGANIAESKSHIVLTDDYMFVAAGDEGCKILDASTGNELFQIDNPDVNSLSADKEVCNTVAQHGDYIFSGNGEAGVYVLENDGDPANSNVNGNLKFKNKKSVNHLLVHNGYLFVARGTGGFIIAEIND